MKVHVDEARCEGHGRCYALAPELFAADDIGNSHEIGDGTVAPELEQQARSRRASPLTTARNTPSRSRRRVDGFARAGDRVGH
jgi:ferredoxin